MKVFFSGPRDGRLNLNLQASAMMAVDYFAKQLKIHRLRTTIQIKLHHRLFLDNSHSEGLCESVDSRNFIIDIALYGNWMSTLAHELVHVKQFARGELSDNLQYWKGKDHSSTKYWEQPWEKEARKLQKKLMVQYITEFEVG
jgi:hypothetical protein